MQNQSFLSLSILPIYTLAKSLLTEFSLFIFSTHLWTPQCKRVFSFIFARLGLLSMPSIDDKKKKKKKIKWRTGNSVQTFNAEIQFDCLCQKREMVGKIELSKDGHSYISHPTCSSFNMTFTPFIMQWGLCPFPLQGADLCDCLDNSIWQNWCH